MKFPTCRLIKKIFLLLTILCTSCSISTGGERKTEQLPDSESETKQLPDIEIKKEIVPENATIHILAKDIFIDMHPTVQGQYISVNAGNKEISFKGELQLSRTVETKKNAAESIQDTTDTLRFLTCIAFLPICAITRSNVFSYDKSYTPESGPKTVYINSDCEVKTTLTIEPGQNYDINIINKENSEPLLIVDHLSGPVYRVLEQKMTCVDSEKPT